MRLSDPLEHVSISRGQQYFFFFRLKWHGLSSFNKGYKEYTAFCWNIVTLFKDQATSHHMNEEGYGPAQLDKTSGNKEAIRGREQQLIDHNGGAQSQGGTSGNAINGISESNPKRQTYLDEAEKEFGKR